MYLVSGYRFKIFGYDAYFFCDFRMEGLEEVDDNVPELENQRYGGAQGDDDDEVWTDLRFMELLYSIILYDAFYTKLC